MNMMSSDDDAEQKHAREFQNLNLFSTDRNHPQPRLSSSLSRAIPRRLGN
jgi:hypothetical protein